MALNKIVVQLDTKQLDEIRQEYLELIAARQPVVEAAIYWSKTLLADDSIQSRAECRLKASVQAFLKYQKEKEEQFSKIIEKLIEKS